MTETEVDVIARIIDLYIKEVKQYYNQPRYTEQITPHTMLGHLWRVLEDTKQKFIHLDAGPAIEVCEFTPEDIEMLKRGRA
jgi:hypothetical protein